MYVCVCLTIESEKEKRNEKEERILKKEGNGREKRALLVHGRSPLLPRSIRTLLRTSVHLDRDQLASFTFLPRSFEAVINGHVMKHLIKVDILSDLQHDFRFAMSIASVITSEVQYSSFKVRVIAWNISQVWHWLWVTLKLH